MKKMKKLLMSVLLLMATSISISASDVDDYKKACYGVNAET